MILALLLTTASVPEAAYGHIAHQEGIEETYVSSSLPDTEAVVRSYFRDIPIMVEIARCESTFRHELTDGSVLQGRVDPADTGVMQINKRYHLQSATAMGLDLHDIYHNMAYARYLYETQGTQPWSASMPCWSKSLAYNN